MAPAAFLDNLLKRGETLVPHRHHPPLSPASPPPKRVAGNRAARRDGGGGAKPSHSAPSRREEVHWLAGQAPRWRGSAASPAPPLPDLAAGGDGVAKDDG
uniref:Uncharacterized protein n=1 Tax=Oryza punctata TaxID=4537 RepID=A0A0E0JX22_ORYPU